MKKLLLGLLLVLCGPTWAQRYNYFAPGGSLTCTGQCLQQTTVLSNGTFLSGNLLQSGSLTRTYTGSSNGNFALGASAEQATITGTANNAFGLSALQNVTSGVNNNAVGAFTLQTVTTGNFNDAFGNDALRHNTGNSNTAIGEGTLFQNIAGSGSTCVGNVACLNYNGPLGQETALGNQALTNDLSGQGNVAIGFNTADTLTTGSNNTIVGTNAGGTTLTTGSFNVLIGNSVDTPGAGTNNYLNLDNVLTCTGTGTPSTSPCTFAGWIAMLSGTDAHPAYNFDATGNTGWGLRLAGTTAIRVDCAATVCASILPGGLQAPTYQVSSATPQTNSFYLPAANCPGVVANATLEMEWCATGILAGAPTGGLQGTGTINAQGLFINGAAVSANLLPLNNTWTGTNTFTASPTGATVNTDFQVGTTGALGTVTTVPGGGEVYANRNAAGIHQLQVLNTNTGNTSEGKIIVGVAGDGNGAFDGTSTAYGAFLPGTASYIGTAGQFTIHTGLSTPIIIGTHDIARMIFDRDGLNVIDFPPLWIGANNAGGEVARLFGSTSGTANTAYMSFYSDVTTNVRSGYVGDASAADSTITLNSDAGAVQLSSSNGAHTLNFSTAGTALLDTHTQLSSSLDFFTAVSGSPDVTRTGQQFAGRSGLPGIYLINSANAANQKLVEMVQGTGFAIGFNNDANSSSNAIISAGRGAANAVASVTLGTAGTAVLLPGLASTSAAQTGTVCWAAGGGNLTVDTTTTCLLSTARVKHRVRPLEAGLAEVMKLRPVSYELKPEFDPGHLGRQVGLISEEVGALDDRLISHEKDGTPLGVRYQQLTAVLIKAIQEQQAQITALQAEVHRRRQP